jgi:hypothetical protein
VLLEVLLVLDQLAALGAMVVHLEFRVGTAVAARDNQPPIGKKREGTKTII